MSNLNFKKIYNLQRELNVLIGRDTVGDSNKLKWLLDYSIALRDEGTELFNCCNWKWWSEEGKKDQYLNIIKYENAKIEVIDCFHFLISIMQILDVSVDDIDEGFIDRYWDDYLTKWNHELFSSFCMVLNNNIGHLIYILSPVDTTGFRNIFLKDLNTKRINEGFIKDMCKEKCKNILLNLIDLCIILDFKKEDILKIYELKHEKNVLRQKNGYSVINKTEDDNLEIEKKI